MQVFHLSRFITFLMISVIFAKSGLTTTELGNFEFLLFISSIVSFFWLSGLIQSFLPLYNNNAAFPGEKINTEHKSPEIFNAFVIIFSFSLLIFILGHIVKHNIYLFDKMSTLPHLDLILLYILISNPTHLIEYIYLLRNKSNQIVNYSLLTFSLQLGIVAGPVILGHGIDIAIWGLVIISGIRFLWLMALLKKYAAITISLPFIKAHLHLGYPLIISTLLTGSAQYIDGMIVALKFDSQAFAIFRYGAKELPLVVMLASGLHNGLLPEFYNSQKISDALTAIRRKSRRLMHALFPASLVLLFFSDYFFPRLFNEDFARSSDVFMVYLLMITSRLLFPNTIIIGLKKTKAIMQIAVISLTINIILSVILSNYYGLVGVALGTVFAYLFEKSFQIVYTYVKLGIKPNRYIPLLAYSIYSTVLVLIFVLIDRNIIQVFGR